MNIRNAILTVAIVVLVYAAPSRAQEKAQLTANVIPDAELSFDSLTTESAPAATADPAAAPAPVPTPPQSGGAIDKTSQDDQWHLLFSPYLWLPGVHGTIGALDRDVGYKASPSDLLSHFRFGLLGTVEARRNRLLIPIDFMWMRLKDSKALPFPGLNATSADLTANMVIFSPKVGFRLINNKKFTADFLTGIRYWYFSESLSFSPPVLVSGLNFSKSQSFVDPLVGGRIQMALSPKVVFTAAGDVGGWGTGSQLEYQIVGLLGYKLNPKMTLQAGYRYLYLDYRKSGAADVIVKNTMSGVVLGVTMNLK